MMKYLNEDNLKSITQEEFDKMIETHEKWIKSRDYRKRLHLFNYNLSNLKIKNRNLHYIVLYECLLNNVLFENCNLNDADIKFSRVMNTNFVNCDLNHGCFYNCKIINTDLSTCDIKKCNFGNLSLDNAIMPDYPMACPEKGSFIGYKKVCDDNDYFIKRYILKLEIPKDAKRSSATGIKCRCNKVKVLEIQNLDGSIAKGITKTKSLYNDKFIYELGKIIEEPKFDECRWHECTSGIHFFMNREDAVNY